MRNAWNKRRTMNGNLYDMGLVSDINQVMAIPTAKQQRLKQLQNQNGFLVEDLIPEKEETVKPTPVRTKKFIVEDMARDANALRESGYR